jgi:hypothetical protein
MGESTLEYEIRTAIKVKKAMVRNVDFILAHLE